jgi:heme exporter protein A
MYPKVKAKNLSYKINEKKLFQNISFELFPSRAIHIQGDNGSGKTTLLKIISGLTRQVKGDLELKLDKSLCFLGHKNALKQYLTVEKNLYLLDVMDHPDLAKHLTQFGLDKSFDINLSSLSFGQQKKIALLRVFLNDSDLLILDEPCVGLDHQSQEYLCAFLNRELTLGKSILFSSHISLDINSEILNLNSKI